MKAALTLDLFTLLGEGAATPAALAVRTGASERGLRILCDYLVVKGFLEKQGDGYARYDTVSTADIQALSDALTAVSEQVGRIGAALAQQ